ncbi:endoribonuclease MazF [Desulfovibrio cuneatus]|uniref:endoribonuclease MazF n=1 Tax=Desulfovibrio cuneatus TaxID=159728 RepID=UPI00041E097D|nr:endoribonuclease MazF [Desulfovibrio cuneatus]
MVKAYVPHCGDIIWLHFDPQAGHEQAGHRPALVLSPKAYNGKTGLCLVVPITNQSKGYPFELALPADCQTTGVVLCDQMRSLDWQVRGAALKEEVGEGFVREVLARFMPLVEG